MVWVKGLAAACLMVSVQLAFSCSQSPFVSKKFIRTSSIWSSNAAWVCSCSSHTPSIRLLLETLKCFFPLSCRLVLLEPRNVNIMGFNYGVEKSLKANQTSFLVEGKYSVHVSANSKHLGKTGKASVLADKLKQLYHAVWSLWCIAHIFIKSYAMKIQIENYNFETYHTPSCVSVCIHATTWLTSTSLVKILFIILFHTVFIF